MNPSQMLVRVTIQWVKLIDQVATVVLLFKIKIGLISEVDLWKDLQLPLIKIIKRSENYRRNLSSKRKKRNSWLMKSKT